MRIGLVCPYAWDVPGGVRQHVDDLAHELMARGHVVQVLAPAEDGDALPEWVTDGGRPIAVSYNGSVARLNFGLKATRAARRWIRDGDFDVIHIHEPVAPGLSIIACWVAQGPMVATWHSSSERSRVLSAGYHLVQTALEKLSGRIAVSEDARRFLVAHVGGDAVLIPNGVRVSAYSTVAPSQDRDPRPTLVFLGRIDEPRKGLDVLLEALPEIRAAVPGVLLRVAGPGDVDDRRKQLDPDLADAVEFLGLISDEEKAQLLVDADLYIAPQLGGESFGIVLIEAMAARTAVVASDLPAFRRVLEEGASGALFERGAPDELASTVVELLGDPERRASYVRAGTERVVDFDWATVVDEVLAVYESVSVPGAKVTEDLRGQLVGRLGGRG